MPDQLASAPIATLFENVLPADAIISDTATIEMLSQDIWSRGVSAALVLAPTTTEELQEIAKIAFENDLKLNPRGAGMSYTNGYTPDQDNTIVLDTSRMDKIVEINTDDMYVTVQAGVNWMSLYEALKPLGVRSPFWGPLSGITSTVGGGVSQNNAFFGAGTYGPSTESVTSVTVVLADGTCVKTGTGGTQNGAPFWRHYGPDLTGLFLGDAGRMGLKAEVTLRLIKAPEFEDWASFEFDTQDACANAAQAVAKTGLACEVFGFDPNLTKIRLKRASLVSDVKTLGNVIKGQGSLLKGLKEGAKIAMAGRSFMEATSWSLHVIVEGHSKAGVAENMASLKQLCFEQGAKETENSIPKIIRSNPFTPMNNMLGPTGERWVPVHGIVPMSKGKDVWRDIETMFEERKDDFEKHDIETGYLVTTLSTNGFLLEPVFIWPDEIFPLHKASVEQSMLERFTERPANPEANAVVKSARKAVVEIFEKYGAAHFQVGRTYPYSKNRNEDSHTLLTRIQSVIDPKSTINPGSLGLD